MKPFSLACCLAVTVLLTGCGTTLKQAAMNVDGEPAFHSLAALPCPSPDWQKGIVQHVRDWKVGEFNGHKSYFLSFRLPEDAAGRYLVVKSYFVSPMTDMRYGMFTHWPNSGRQPWAFPPRISRVTADGPSPLSTPDDFRLNTGFRQQNVLGIPNRIVESWLQAAFRIDASLAGQCLLIDAEPGLIGEMRRIPGALWPLREPAGVIPIFAGGLIMVPIPGSMHLAWDLHFGHLGKVQVQLVDGDHLYRASLGTKMSREWIKPPGARRSLQTRLFAVPVPDGYGFFDESRGDIHRWWLYRPVPGGETRLYLREGPAPSPEVTPFVEFVLKDTRASVARDAVFQRDDETMDGIRCARIRATGHNDRAYGLPWAMEDLLCLVPDPRKQGRFRSVRIGGDITVGPDQTGVPEGWMEDIRRFIRSIRWSNAVSPANQSRTRP